MSTEDIKNKIFEMIPGSSISRHHKIVLSMVLDSLSSEQLEAVYSTLETEKKKMNGLARQEERINLKQEVFMENILNEIKADV